MGALTSRKGLAVLAAVALGLGLCLGCSREPRPTPTAHSVVPPATASALLPRTLVPGQPDSPGSPEAGGLPNAGSLAGAEATPPPQVYTVQPGDTLSSIAARFGIGLDALIRANTLADPNNLRVGQSLKIPSNTAEWSPADRLLPDSEFVNGPGYVGFRVGEVCSRHAGYLCQYSEAVGGQVLSGPDVVARVAREYGVGPRLLLAALEYLGGWVDNPSPPGAALSYPMGYRKSGVENLSRQLAWAANRLNEGYYNWRGRGAVPISWEDGSVTAYAPTLNAATAGLQYFFSLNSVRAEWETQVGTGAGSFLETYRRLFGDPAQYAVEPLVPADTPLPALELPWSRDELWFYTSGPHGGWGEGSAWSAIDFVPDEGYLGCQAARSWATAVAPGVIAFSQEGVVMLDLDGDGEARTGWVVLYLHIASEGRVVVDTRVNTGDRIGHPSCEGGFGDASHLHFARLYNGEWIAADGPLPMILSGWQIHSSGISYDGTATRGDEARTAAEAFDPERNGLSAQRP